MEAGPLAPCSFFDGRSPAAASPSVVMVGAARVLTAVAEAAENDEAVARDNLCLRSAASAAPASSSFRTALFTSWALSHCQAAAAGAPPSKEVAAAGLPPVAGAAPAASSAGAFVGPTDASAIVGSDVNR